MRRAEWAFAALLLLVLAPAGLALAGVWSSLDYWSHGWLVPFVALWMVWAGRGARRGIPIRPDGRAAPFGIVALALYVLGLGAGSASAQGLAAVLALAAAVWLLRGLAWLRALAFPLAFLLFMVPPPPDWIRPGIVQLQLFVSQAAVATLDVLGAGVTREGNVLRLPDGQALFVAEACSGVTSVVTLTPLAVMLAWFLRTPPWRALALGLAVVPIALAANLVRVVGTVLAAHRFGVVAVTGPSVHEAAGLAVYVLGCLALVALAGALRAPPAAD